MLTSERPSYHKLLQVPSNAAKETAQSKNAISKQKARFSPEYITQFAIKWLKAGQSKKVPTVVSNTPEGPEKKNTNAVAIQEVLFKASRSVPILA